VCKLCDDIESMPHIWVTCEIHMTTERWEDHVDVIGEDIWPNVAYNYKSTQHK